MAADDSKFRCRLKSEPAWRESRLTVGRIYFWNRAGGMVFIESSRREKELNPPKDYVIWSSKYEGLSTFESPKATLPGKAESLKMPQTTQPTASLYSKLANWFKTPGKNAEEHFEVGLNSDRMNIIISGKQSQSSAVDKYEAARRRVLEHRVDIWKDISEFVGFDGVLPASRSDKIMAQMVEKKERLAAEKRPWSITWLDLSNAWNMLMNPFQSHLQLPLPEMEKKPQMLTSEFPKVYQTRTKRLSPFVEWDIIEENAPIRANIRIYSSLECKHDGLRAAIKQSPYYDLDD